MIAGFGVLVLGGVLSFFGYRQVLTFRTALRKGATP